MKLSQIRIGSDKLIKVIELLESKENWLERPGFSGGGTKVLNFDSVEADGNTGGSGQAGMVEFFIIGISFNNAKGQKEPKSEEVLKKFLGIIL